MALPQSVRGGLGVFCLFTACRHHGLGTFVPSQYHVAIPGKSKVVLPGHPPVKLYYWSPSAYQTGIAQVAVNGTVIQMYDAEKTVCDMIRLRNKIGADTVKEAEKSYLQRQDRDLAKLLGYARTLGMETLVRQRLSLLV
jgi:predicted transcriptional regulator of viral defense system